MSQPARSALAARRRACAPKFAALGDPTRLSLLATLCAGRACSISQLTENTKLTRQAVTKHLRVLENAGLVHQARFGRERRFAFDPRPIEDLKEYLERVSGQWDEALERLRSFLER